MDYLDIVKGRFFDVNPGIFYSKLPDMAFISLSGSVQQGGKPFDYEIVNDAEWRYNSVISNLLTTRAWNMVISSSTPLNWMENGYVLTRDGKVFIITGVAMDRKDAPREAQRVFVIPPDTKYIISLKEYDAPRRK